MLRTMFLTVVAFGFAAVAGAGEVEFAGIGGVQLPKFALARMGSSGFGQGGYITDIAWSADGNRIVSFGQGDGPTRSLRVWNARTGAALLSLNMDGYGKESFTGNLLLVGDRPNTAEPSQKFHVIDLTTGRESQTYTHSPYTESASLSADGKLLAVATDDWSVTIVDLKTSQVITKLPPLETKSNVASFPHVKFSPTGNLLTVCDSDYRFKVLDLSDPKAPKDHCKPIQHGSYCKLVFGPRKDTAATIGNNGQIILWDLAKGESVRQWKHGNVSAMGGGYSPDGNLIATAGADDMIRLWDTKTGAMKLEIRPEERPMALAFSPDGNQLASGGGQGKVRLWNPNTGQELSLTKDAPPTGSAEAIAIDPTGRYIAVAGNQGAVTLWDLTPGSKAELLREPEENAAGRFDPRIGPNWLAFNPAGDRLLAGSSNRHNSFSVWNPQTRERALRLEGHIWPITAVACSPDGETYASGSRDKTIRLWKKTGQFLRSMTGSGQEVLTIAFSGDGKMIASAGFGDQIDLWNVATGEQLKTLKSSGGHNGPMCVSFSPIADRLVSAEGNGGFRLWNTADGSVVKAVGSDPAAGFKPDALRFRSLAWSPLGDLLAGAGSDGKVHLFDGATGDERAALTGHDAQVASIGWHRGGRLLVSGGTDAVIYVWDTARAVKGS